MNKTLLAMLEDELKKLDEYIEYMQLSDQSWSKEFTSLWRQRQFVRRALRRYNKILSRCG